MGFTFPTAGSTTKPNDSAREEAIRLSRDCPHCGGSGMATVYLPQYYGQPIGVATDGRHYITRTAAHCDCPHGVWIRGGNSPELQRRIPFLDDMLKKRCRVDWTLADPTESVAPTDLPSPLCPRCRQPMGGGRGGLPWTCFRECGPSQFKLAVVSVPRYQEAVL